MPLSRRKVQRKRFILDIQITYLLYAYFSRIQNYVQNLIKIFTICAKNKLRAANQNVYIGALTKSLLQVNIQVNSKQTCTKQTNS